MVSVHNIAINLNAKRERGLDWITVQTNTARAAQGQGAVTEDQYLEALVQQAAESWADQESDADRDSLRELFRTASAAQRAAARTALGG